jgi:hypothetical protein
MILPMRNMFKTHVFPFFPLVIILFFTKTVEPMLYGQSFN